VIRHLFCICIIFTSISFGQQAHIILGKNASPMEKYSGQELQRYLYMLGHELPKVCDDAAVYDGGFVIGTTASNSILKSLADSGFLSPDELGPQSYQLKKLSVNGHDIIAVLGTEDTGVLYGVYGLLQDYYGINFYMSGDVLPPQTSLVTLPDVNEIRKPQMYIRGFLPWTNFPQSATVYSWQDWKYVIDQMAKMRMNFLHIHNYNGEGKHNEMFHNFELNGYISRSWMATASSGHGWAGPKWNVNEYLFGSSDLFDDYDFGADCALHNEKLSNKEVFKKGTNLFKRVIDYAHSRGVKIGLGIDLDKIPAEYNVSASDTDVIKARIEQIATDYPNLDYLICFQSETMGSDSTAWQKMFMGWYNGLKATNPKLKFAVSGWGLKPESIQSLPPDVICAPIAPYSAKWPDGSQYGEREYWACPWLERDMASSEYYYPYNIHLSDTISCYQSLRTSNTKGLYCLTWRITDAIDPKLWYIANAPWYDSAKFTNSEAVYDHYVKSCYGSNASKLITSIINQNEPYASDFGECTATPPFDGDLRYSDSGFLFNLYRFRFYNSNAIIPEFTDASSYSSQSGTQNAGANEGGQCVAYIQDKDWVMFSSINFNSDWNTFQVRAASATNGGNIEIRLDSVSGLLIGEGVISGSGDWQKWDNYSCTIKGTTGTHDVYFVFRGHKIDDRQKALTQLTAINNTIEAETDSSRKARLELLRCRIASEYNHIELDTGAPSMSVAQFTEKMAEWVNNFNKRVVDISSLGNIQSVQNRFVQLNYVNKIAEVRSAQNVKMPSHVQAKGTLNGAFISWKNEEPAIKGFYVYRNGIKVSQLLSKNDISWDDTIKGKHRYSVTAVNTSGMESPQFSSPSCYAGSSDTNAPKIILVSPQSSLAKGQPFEITVRLLDNRKNELLNAVLYYRSIGNPDWTAVNMTRRSRAVFCSTVKLPDDTEGIEYYVSASDGSNNCVFPPSAPQQGLSAIIYVMPDNIAPNVPENVKFSKGRLIWNASSGDVFGYKIYRSRKASFEIGCVNYLTFVDAFTTSFADNGLDFDSTRIDTCFYKITAVDRFGNESAPFQIVNNSSINQNCVQ